MNLLPEKNDHHAPEANVKSLWRSLPARFWRLLSHNLIWKLLALLLAVCLWAGLITQDPTLTRERVFNDVPISTTGSDTLRRNGLIVISGLDSDEPVRLRVEVPQREYNTVTTLNYNPRVDLSKVTEAGTQIVKVSTTSSTTYGTVTEIYPDSLEIVVDEYVTNYRVPVSVNLVNDYPAGFYGITPSLDPSTVSVSGPKSVVERIARVVVDFDVSRLPSQAGLVRTASPMSFVDAEGNEINSSLVEVTSAGVLLRSIVVEQQLYATKTLPISSLALTSGVPADGYEVKSVTSTPSMLVAAGDELGLNALDTLFVEQAVDVTGFTESFTVDLRVRKPSELVYMSADTVTLYVEIGPKIATREFTDVKLTFQDAASHQKVSANAKTVNVSLSGPQLVLDALKSASLTAYVQVADLETGIYDLPVLLTVKDVDPRTITYAITPQNVSVTIETTD